MRAMYRNVFNAFANYLQEIIEQQLRGKGIILYL
jgi:hypothetical protein